MNFLADALPTVNYDYGAELMNMLITLALVLGVAFLFLFILKKFMRSKIKQLNRTTGIKILERRALTQKSSLYLVDILGKGVVISESPTGGIQLITEFPPGTDLELMLAEEEQALKTSSPWKEGFQKKIGQLFKKNKIKT